MTRGLAEAAGSARGPRLGRRSPAEAMVRPAPLLDALEQLPLTLCHKDAWRRNIPRRLARLAATR